MATECVPGLGLPETSAFRFRSAVLLDRDSRKTSASSLSFVSKQSYRTQSSSRSYKSMTACHLAASSNHTSKLRSTSTGSTPISETLTESKGFPVALATVSVRRLAHKPVLGASRSFTSSQCLSNSRRS